MARTDTENLVISLEARIAQFEKNMAKANATAQKNFGQVERRSQQASQRVNQHMASATAGVTRFAGALKGLAAGFGLGIGVSGLQRLVTDSLAAADSIGEMAQVVNVSTGFLQEMRFAAQLSGVETRGLDDSLRRLTRRVGLFIAEGGGPAANALERLGLASQITSGELRGTEPIFNAVVRALEGVESQAERAALASQLFGDDFGPKLVPLLDQGTEGIARLREEANRLGVVMSDELIAKAASANDQLDRLAFIIRTKTTIGVVEFADEVRGLVRELQPLVEWLERLVSARPGGLPSIADAFPTDLLGSTKREIKTITDFLRSLGFAIGEVREEASEPLRVDIRGASGIEPPSTGAPTTPVDPMPWLRPSPDRRDAQRFDLPVAFTTETGAEGFATQLDHLRQMAQEVETVTGKTDELTAAQIAAQNAGQQFALTVSQGLTSAITGADSFKDALAGIIKQLAEAIIQAIIFRAITGAIGAPGAGGEAGTGLLGAFEGGFAQGGTIPAGKWGVVGERGPELITGPAKITPMSGGAQSLVVNTSISVNVEAGGSRGETADTELANKIGMEMETIIDSRITEQIRQQLRSGNMLNPTRSTL